MAPRQVSTPSVGSVPSRCETPGSRSTITVGTCQARLIPLALTGHVDEAADEWLGRATLLRTDARCPRRLFHTQGRVRRKAGGEGILQGPRQSDVCREPDARGAWLDRASFSISSAFAEDPRARRRWPASPMASPESREVALWFNALWAQ